MLRAGTLNKQISIQRHGQGTDEWNTPLPGAIAWVEVAKVWANIRHMSGSETIRAGAEVSTVRVSIRIRYRAGINAGMRVVHAGQVYDIEAPLPDSTRRWLDLACKLIQ